MGQGKARMTEAIECRVCSFRNPPGQGRCVRCRAALGPRDVPVPGPLGGARRFLRLPHLPERLRRVRYALARRFEDSLPTGIGHRFPWTAGYLGLFLGAGQWYNHQPRKAVVMGLVQAGLITWALVNIYHPWNNWMLLAALAWTLFMMGDAFSAAVRINGQPWRLRLLVALWSSLFFFVGLMLIGLQFFGHGVFTLTTVRSPNLGPHLERGDKVFVLNRWFLREGIQPGDVVYFRQTNSYTYQIEGAFGMDYYTVREPSAFGVVTGLPGQVVERIDDEHIFLDGETAPPALLPVNPSGFPSGFRIEAPEDHYAILPTHPVSDRGVSAMMGRDASVAAPREMLLQGRILVDYPEGATVAHGDIRGVVLFRYHPPPRRRWFGRGDGLWDDYPEGFLSQ